MNNKRLRYLSGKIGAAIAVLSLMAFAPGASAEDFRLGGVSSLSGRAAVFAREVNEGVEAYVKYWNDQGGYRGRHVVIETLDDETNPATAVNALKKLAGDPTISAVLMATSGQTAVAIKGISDEYRVPVVGTSILESLGVPAAKYYFRGMPGSSDYIAVLVDWLKAHNHKTLAILEPNDATGQADIDAFKRLAPAAGIEITAQELFGSADKDFTPQLLKIRNANPDFLYLGAVGAPAILALKQIRQLRITIPLVVNEAALGGPFYAAIGGIENAEGIYTLLEQGSIIKEATGRSAEFGRELAKRLNHPPTQFDTAGWDIAALLAHAAETSDGSREGLRNALEATRDFPVIGGFYSMSPENHGGKDRRSIGVARLVKGELTTAPSRGRRCGRGYDIGLRGESIVAAVTEENITDEVCARFGAAPDARTAQLMTGLVRHLHAFAREVGLTREEWLTAIGFLTAAGKKSDSKRNEMMLVSDVLGLSMLTVMLDLAVPQGATPNTIEGPFFIPNSPVLELGGDMRADAPGTLCYMFGTVSDLEGRPVEGARLDIWQADDEGLYEGQIGKPDGYLRATFVTGPDGRYCAKTIVPQHYSIPMDGAVGDLVRATGVSADRPAHIHLMAHADGYEPLVTHVFRKGAQYLEEDAVYGVRPELIVDFAPHEPGEAPSGERTMEPYSTVQFDIVLTAAKP